MYCVLHAQARKSKSAGVNLMQKRLTDIRRQLSGKRLSADQKEMLQEKHDEV